MIIINEKNLNLKDIFQYLKINGLLDDFISKFYTKNIFKSKRLIEIVCADWIDKVSYVESIYYGDMLIDSRNKDMEYHNFNKEGFESEKNRVFDKKELTTSLEKLPLEKLNEIINDYLKKAIKDNISKCDIDKIIELYEYLLKNNLMDDLESRIYKERKITNIEKTESNDKVYANVYYKDIYYFDDIEIYSIERKEYHICDKKHDGTFDCPIKEKQKENIYIIDILNLLLISNKSSIQSIKEKYVNHSLEQKPKKSPNEKITKEKAMQLYDILNRTGALEEFKSRILILLEIEPKENKNLIESSQYNTTKSQTGVKETFLYNGIKLCSIEKEIVSATPSIRKCTEDDLINCLLNINEETFEILEKIYVKNKKTSSELQLKRLKLYNYIIKNNLAEKIQDRLKEERKILEEKTVDNQFGFNYKEVECEEVYYLDGEKICSIIKPVITKDNYWRTTIGEMEDIPLEMHKKEVILFDLNEFVFNLDEAAIDKVLEKFHINFTETSLSEEKKDISMQEENNSEEFQVTSDLLTNIRKAKEILEIIKTLINQEQISKINNIESVLYDLEDSIQEPNKLTL